MFAVLVVVVVLVVPAAPAALVVLVDRGRIRLVAERGLSPPELPGGGDDGTTAALSATSPPGVIAGTSAGC